MSSTMTAGADIASVPNSMDAEEWRLRIQTAAAYRIIDHLGWTELIWGHTTTRVPGPDHHFLINPYGLRYDEITASSLVKIDLDGNIVEPSDYPVNPAGFVIHSAIHQHREDAHCVMHTHTRAGMAVAVPTTLPPELRRLRRAERLETRLMHRWLNSPADPWSPGEEADGAPAGELGRGRRSHGRGNRPARLPGDLRARAFEF